MTGWHILPGIKMDGRVDSPESRNSTSGHLQKFAVMQNCHHLVKQYLKLASNCTLDFSLRNR